MPDTVTSTPAPVAQNQGEPSLLSAVQTPAAQPQGQQPQQQQQPAQQPAQGSQPAAQPPSGQPPAAQPQGQQPPQQQQQAAQPQGQQPQQQAQGEYAFQTPKGFDAIDEGLVNTFTPLAKEIGLRSEQAQRLIDLYAEVTLRQQEAMQNAQLAQIAEWRNQIKASPTANEDLALAQRVVSQYMTPDQAEFFAGKASWLGNHPHVVAFLAKMGRLVANDRPVIDSTAPSPAAKTDGTIESLATKLFPGMKP